MLSITGKSNAEGAETLTGSSESSPPSSNSIKNIKREPFSTLSPLNDQTMLDETCASNVSISGGNLTSADASVKHEQQQQQRDCPTTNNTIASTSMLHQNSNNSFKMCSNTTGNASSSSPTYGSEHSSGAADILKDLNSPEKNINKIKVSLSSLETELKSEEDNDSKATLDKKDENDTGNLIGNIKKEDVNISPDMSPAGFGSIPNLSGSNSVELENEVTKTKTTLNMNNDNNGIKCNNNEKMATLLGALNDNSTTKGCPEDSLSTIGGSNSLFLNTSAMDPLAIGDGGGGHHSATAVNMMNNSSNNNSGGGDPISNCFEYMQQQNHIFVFSTQLANKGAESVLSGQYPTIIAYHCTQPVTKNFLEEFFMKNPTKMSKLQRQNTLNNLCNLTGGVGGVGGQQWAGGCTNIGAKMTQKPLNRSKVNFTGLNLNSDKLSLQNPAALGFSEGAPEVPGGGGATNENDLMCAEQNQHNIDGGGANSPGSATFAGTRAGLKPPIGATMDPSVGSDGGGGGGSGTPSLQGIKVPDENLTPQQRQHREEQLAKLKQLDQFLSNPLLGGGNQLAKMGADSVPGNHGGGGGGVGGGGVGLNMANADPSAALGAKTNANNSLNSKLRASEGSNEIGFMSHSPDMVMAKYMGDDELNSNAVKLMGAGSNTNTHPEIGGPVDIAAELEWSKFQQQFLEERVKGKCQGQGPNPATGCMPPAILSRSNSASIGNNNQNLRLSQAPPPPYHHPSVQRSASVPIATQSPNPSSPNNPTSNMSLPSPRTSGVLAMQTNSPSVDMHAPIGSAPPILNLNTQDKSSSFQSEGSPSNCGINNNNNNNSNNRSRNSQMNQFSSSNPSTPLSHLSPKDLESFHSNIPTAADLKNASHLSPQRSPRTPLMPSDSANMDGGFHSASPGLSFPQNMANASIGGIGGGGGGGGGGYKGPGPMQNPNSAQFCRRTDDLPLDPNSNRSAVQKKPSLTFDPISSLAQMSQQLASSVSFNAGGSAGSMGMGVGANDINSPNCGNHNMEGMINSINSGIDHCGSAGSSSGNMGNINGPPGHLISSNACHMNSMLGPMGQRLLNPKMCGGFIPGRDGPGGGMHAVLPAHRLMGGRMGMGFGNFNVSPNIQVKASTPNTIQYMPVRPQNSSNSNNNMRMPPSLEFLRYANPQMMPGNALENSHMMGQANLSGPGGPSDSGKLNNSGINFFGNCNQMGGNQEDMLASANLVSGHDMSINSPNAASMMIRGMRPPVRQQSMAQAAGNQMAHGSPRMQSQAMPPGMHGNFDNDVQDPIGCGDSAMFIGNNCGGNGPVQSCAQGSISGGPGRGGQMYPSAGNIPKSVNPLGSSGEMSSASAANMLNNENNPSMQSRDIGNVVGYKPPFVGPASNDVKYAQQYHSFQQQLYATSTTRNQQNAGNNNMGSNVSTNAPRFI